MSHLSPLSTTLLKAPVGPSEELVATVPDLHFGVVPINGIADLSYTESFAYPRKRNRNDSGCSLSDFDISSGDEDFSLNSSKRPCSTIPSPYYTPITCPPEKEFTLELDAVLQFDAGVVSAGQDIIPITSGGTAINSYSSSQFFSNSVNPLHPKTKCLDQVLTGMQPAELPTNPYKHDLMLNCDHECKLVITEHPEEVRQSRVCKLQPFFATCMYIGPVYLHACFNTSTVFT